MRGTNRGGWSALRDAVSTQLWPIPALGIAVAAVAGVLLPRLDARIDDNLPPTVANYLFGAGASAARAVLEAVAGSLITVTSLTFSLTVVTLQLASSQFSPRLLRTFSSDRFVQATLALFLGTFTYALTVLRTVRTPADDQDLFVPQISVTVAFLLRRHQCVRAGDLPGLPCQGNPRGTIPPSTRTPPQPCNASCPNTTPTRRLPASRNRPHTACRCSRRRPGSWCGSTSRRCCPPPGTPTRG